ncbi:MAG: hypothetical protein KGO02_06085, partial [Alphaproteobacteria bacterium]|nr:hypothetical protein [Alphaproteobacteria bacterium]
MTVNNTMFPDAADQERFARLDELVLNMKQASHKSRRKIKTPASQYRIVVGDFLTPLYYPGFRRHVDTPCMTVKVNKTRRQAPNDKRIYPTINNSTIQHARLVETTHYDQPICDFSPSADLE